MYPLLTRDPVSGGELIVTRLECPSSGIVLEGQFSLGWIGRLMPDQLEFVELLLKNRGNVQKVATDMNIAYNTARSRLDEIVKALGGGEEGEAGLPPESEVAKPTSLNRRAILDQLAAKHISVEEATRLLKGQAEKTPG